MQMAIRFVSFIVEALSEMGRIETTFWLTFLSLFFGGAGMVLSFLTFCCFTHVSPWILLKGMEHVVIASSAVGVGTVFFHRHIQSWLNKALQH